MPGVGLVGSEEISPKHIFCISERVHLVWSKSTSKFAPDGRHWSLPNHNGLTLHSIPLSHIIVFPVVSFAIFLLVSFSLITVRFDSSKQLLSHAFSFRYDGGRGGSWKREERKEAGKYA